MPLSADLRMKLLDAIETDSLVFLCGAGLSMASPSDLPSALRVSQICFDHRSAIESLNPALRDDVDKLAGVFHSRGDFEKVFIPLVPWNELMGTPNKGHAAVSDLLISRAAHAAMSSNFDHMIEAWGQNLKVDFRGALNGQQAEAFRAAANPLLKFHGCIDIAREQTLWTQGQLAEPATQARIASCTQWMNLHLPGKHLVVVGFWSDWGYLNDVLTDAFTTGTATAVTVIDPSTTAALQTKAPVLWAKLNALSLAFEHVQGSGADVLDELREAFSRSWSKRFYAIGRGLLNAAATTPATLTTIAAAAGPTLVPDLLNGEDLYDLRRDAEGISYSRAAKLKLPPPHCAQASLLHATLLDAGATKERSWLRYNGSLVRIVNGGGQSLEAVQGAFKEPVTAPNADMVVCAGSIRTGVPARVIPAGRGMSIVRPAAGTGARWLTLEEARTELHI
jgi:hypothetical protein